MRSSRKPLRVLVPAVLAAAVVLVPGAAAADEGNGDPLGGITGPLRDALGGGGTGGTGSAPGGQLPGPEDVPQLPLPGTGSEDEAPALPEPPAELGPEQLAELLAPLGISEECVTGVYEDFEAIGEALAGGGEDLLNLLTQLVGALQNGGAGLGPEALTENDLATALQDLVTTLQEQCAPAHGGGTPPPADGGHSAPPAAKPHEQAPAAPVAAPVAAAPVSYLGYAPTGGTGDEAERGGPLAALAGIVLLSGLGAAGYRVGTRGSGARG
ncbi:hypothetical protein ACI797_00725 [Geodermatophilus sp. SYSU D00691]